ncbi:MAG: helix-turn-helix transcriptional regulator [Alphaproteobacteria bacterium]|nr:helix-turn-helix transcriptional regulator [Alphaproteobacteria bacterium]MCB9974883.1 helix-turn-helix transcriptional regulator [Rhodospirillales bacterium]
MKTRKTRKTKGVPDDIDKHVGKQLKSRRVLLGMSQEKLAESVGITFQQVQKYERGTNRISAGRLLKFSKTLQVPVSFFYEGIEEILSGDSSTGKSYGFSDTEQTVLAESLPDDIMSRKETLDLLRSYYSIQDPSMRKMIQKMIKSMASGKIEKK